MNEIAVVIPCRNLGRFVLDALGSVHAQTRPASEIIVVDDGSDDTYTQHVLTSASKSGTYVVRTPHRGVAAARNLGIRLTSAPYLVLLDADDELTPRYLERLGGVLDVQSTLDFITCTLQAFGDADYAWTPPPCTLIHTLARGGPHVSSMFRRRVWDAVGGFDETLEGYEDTDFWLNALRQGYQGDVIAEPLLRYRVRGDSRYARVLNRKTFLPTIERLYHRHWPAFVRQQRLELIFEKDRFLQEQSAHSTYLRQRRSELEQDLGRLNSAITEVTADVARSGEAALEWGDCRRTHPISGFWGFDRGVPVDRHYIERFLERHQTDIKGRVLEVKDSWYTSRYGGTRVAQADVIDIVEGNPHATIYADLTNPKSLPSDAFDCFILTQTLHVIYDISAVVRTAYQLLKPGGVLLCTIPCLSRVSDETTGLDEGDFWRLTPAASRTLFAKLFPPDAIDVASEGTLVACAGFLQGLAAHELPAGALSVSDPSFPLICCVRAVKPLTPEPRSRHTVASIVPTITRAAILAYHRVGSYDLDTHRLAITAEDFLAHMRHLADQYAVMPLEDLCERLGSSSLPSRAVAVTLDDGYLDNLTIVAPILADLGISATFFVTTERLDERHEHWWDVLELIMTSTADRSPALDLNGDGTDVRVVTTQSDLVSVHKALIEQIYDSSIDQRRQILERVIRWSGLEPRARETHRRMTADEIRTLAAKPYASIGAHSVHHLNLPGQPLEVQRNEVVRCKRTLEELIDRPVACFAYPYGEFNHDLVRVVRDAGFQYGVTVGNRPARLSAERLLLPRCEAPAVPVRQFSDWLANVVADR